MREERLNKRLSLAECGKRTRVAVRFLEAMEEERWNALPSESHRLGFLRLYAKFLGVWSDDMLTAYRSRASQAEAQESQENPPAINARAARLAATWSLGSWQQASVLGICLLMLAWGLYHGMGRHGIEARNVYWARFHKKVTPLALVTRRPYAQRLTVKADKDSWLRVLENRRLLFEGILPAATIKEWAGPGPFRIRVANVHDVSLYWNGQPVDLEPARGGSTAELRLPPH